MPYARPFLKLVLQGELGVSEVFSYGLHLVGGPIAPINTIPQGVIDACEEFHDSGVIGSIAVLKTIKMNLIGEDGRYVDDDTTLYDFPGQGIVPSPTAKQAMQIATVVSLQAAADRGLASKGRFYIPAPAAGPQSPEMTMAQTDQLAVVTAGRTFINALNAASGDWQVGLVSNVGAGREREVTRVRVGRAFDTIRSRRNKVTEEYITQPIP